MRGADLFTVAAVEVTSAIFWGDNVSGFTLFTVFFSSSSVRSITPPSGRLAGEAAGEVFTGGAGLIEAAFTVDGSLRGGSGGGIAGDGTVLMTCVRTAGLDTGGGGVATG